MVKFDHIFLRPSDWDASVTFYRNILGCEIVNSWGADGDSRGAEMKNGSGFEIVIADPHEELDDSSQRPDLFDSKPSVYFRVAKLDEYLAGLPSLNGLVVHPEDTHWGVRWCVFRDPDCNLVVLFEQSEASE